MRKEVIFAVSAGIIFGIILALGIWRANSALNETPSEQPQTKAPSKKVAGFELAILEPEEKDVILDDFVEIKGSTSPNTWVAVSAEDTDYVLRSDTNGEFFQEVDLTGGVNFLVVKAFNDQGESIEKTVTVVYSSQFAERLQEGEE